MEVLSEDWNEDFVFEAVPDDYDESGVDGNCREPFGPATPNGRPATRERLVIVPQAIKERQANVHGDLGQVKDFALLVEELKRLRIVANSKGLVEGPSAELWKEADDIIDLASSDTDHNHYQHHQPNHNHHHQHHHSNHTSSTAALPPLPYPPQSPSSPSFGLGFDPFEDESISPISAMSRKRRKSILALDDDFYAAPPAAPTAATAAAAAAAVVVNGHRDKQQSPLPQQQQQQQQPLPSLDGASKLPCSLSRIPSRSNRQHDANSVARAVIEHVHQRRAAAAAAATAVPSPCSTTDNLAMTATATAATKKMPFDSTTLRELVAHVRLLSRRLADVVRSAESQSPLFSRSQSQSPHMSPITTTTTTTTMTTTTTAMTSMTSMTASTTTAATTTTAPSLGQMFASSVAGSSSPSTTFGARRPAKKSKSATDILAQMKSKEPEIGSHMLMAVI